MLVLLTARPRFGRCRPPGAHVGGEVRCAHELGADGGVAVPPGCSGPRGVCWCRPSGRTSARRPQASRRRRPDSARRRRGSSPGYRAASRSAFITCRPRHRRRSCRRTSARRSAPRARERRADSTAWMRARSAKAPSARAAADLRGEVATCAVNCSTVDIVVRASLLWGGRRRWTRCADRRAR